MDRQCKLEIARAIGSCKGHVRAADIVSATGLPVLTVNRYLNAMSYECGAHLEVSSDGSLSYIFAGNFAWRYQMGRWQKMVITVLSVLQRSLFAGIKIAFGTCLVLSVSFLYALTFVVLEIVAVFTSLESATGNMRREFFDLWRYYFMRQDNSGSLKKKSRLPVFLENCFGFLFGPADPNVHMQSESWRQIAGTIRACGGVVIGEQLQVWSRQEKAQLFDLSVLVRLDGMPIVSDSGAVLYYFPALAAPPAAGDDFAGKRLAFLQEKIWHFSGVETKDLLPVLILALVNVAGCNLAYFGLHLLPFMVKQVPIYWGITFMWMYGNAFLAFPLARLFICAYRNHVITVGNVTRKLLSEELQYPSAEMKVRLAEAHQAALELSEKQGETTVVFTTEKDALAQFIEEKSSPG